MIVMLGLPLTMLVLAPCLLPSASAVVEVAPEVTVASEAAAVPVETAVEEGRLTRRVEVGTQS